MWHLDTLLVESVDWKNIDMVSLHEEEEPSGRKTRHRGPTLIGRPKGMVSLLLWYKMVAIHSLFWYLGLRLWSGSE